MAAVFAVFLVAALLAFARAEGRAQRIERLRALATGGIRISKAFLAKGTEIVDLAAARLAQEHRNPAGLDWILEAVRRGRADGTERGSDP
jgi:hypothetical protein